MKSMLSVVFRKVGVFSSDALKDIKKKAFQLPVD